MQDILWFFAGRMIEGFDGGLPHRNLEASLASKALYRARRKAFSRNLKTALSMRRLKNPERLPPLANEEIAIDNIERMIRGGKAVMLPRIPLSRIDRWVSIFERFSRGEPGFASFDIVISEGRLAIEGGMDALIRLEILRDAGERTVNARKKPTASRPASSRPTRVAAVKAEPASALAESRRPEERARRAAS
jgi:hypothetical protein